MIYGPDFYIHFITSRLHDPFGESRTLPTEPIQTQMLPILTIFKAQEYQSGSSGWFLGTWYRDCSDYSQHHKTTRENAPDSYKGIIKYMCGHRNV